MTAKQKIAIVIGAVGFVSGLSGGSRLLAQQATTPPSAGNAQAHDNPLSELSPDNHALFDALREAAKNVNSENSGSERRGLRRGSIFMKRIPLSRAFKA